MVKNCGFFGFRLQIFVNNKCQILVNEIIYTFFSPCYNAKIQ